MSEYFDSRDTMSAECREAELLASLPKQVAFAKAQTPYFAELFKEIDPVSIDSRETLSKLPITYKSDLVAAQSEKPPFGGMNATPVGDLLRVFRSPGPICEPEGKGDDFWRGARALHAAGVRKGDIVHNSFSYHLTPGAWLLDSAARSLGAAVFPAGVGNTDLQVEAMSHFQANVFCGTPDFLKILMERAREMEANVSSLKKAIVGGGALPPSLRQLISDEFGFTPLQNYGTADLGIIAYESPAMEGMLINEGAIVEIVRPGSGEPVTEGEVGEVVVTLLNKDYPLTRFATGDLSAIMSGKSPCGRTAPRIKGWMGRADQTTKIRGMFVRPTQLEQVRTAHPEVLKLRLTVTSENHRDQFGVACETENHDPNLAEKIGATVSKFINLSGAVTLVPPGSLPSDGKVIEDARSYD